MKTIVEWGTPKQATERKICGISGHFRVDNPKQADQLARQLIHTLTQGRLNVASSQDFRVSRAAPRKVIWSDDNRVWVCISLLDGVPRGSFSGVADSEARDRTQAQVNRSTQA